MGGWCGWVGGVCGCGEWVWVWVWWLGVVGMLGCGVGGSGGWWMSGVVDGGCGGCGGWVVAAASD